MADPQELKKGTKVGWNSPGGKTEGKVTEKVGDDKYEVESAKSGKKAEHKSDALDKK